ncbi:MAG: peptidylprolyl isomerase [Melioribacteraceae bacterium]|nr:peptidylprolyl isomerase [Melioribacteraceae bacterium]
MKSLEKLLKISTNILFLSFFVFNSCTEKKQDDKKIIKVNESVLTEAELDSMIYEKSNSAKLREELINEWIEDEILFHEAQKEGILENSDYKKILIKAQKKLANSFLIKKILEEQDFQIKEDEVKKYYEEHKDEFKLIDDLYNVKIATLKNYEDAITFRDKLIETNWNLAENYFKAEKISYEIKELSLYKNEIQPIQLLRILNIISVNEISSVIEIDNNNFLIVQLLYKFSKNEIPKIEFVNKEVKQKLLVNKQKEFIDNYIKELISEHNLEIERFE